jgi:hypothetical protein
MSETLTEKTLELETGAIGCISPDRHQKRWLQKVRHLEEKILAARSLEEKINLQEQLADLNRIETKKSALILDIHNLSSES